MQGIGFAGYFVPPEIVGFFNGKIEIGPLEFEICIKLHLLDHVLLNDSPLDYVSFHLTCSLQSFFLPLNFYCVKDFYILLFYFSKKKKRGKNIYIHTHLILMMTIKVQITNITCQNQLSSNLELTLNIKCQKCNLVFKFIF